jgi:hypothetical protein
VGLLRDLEGDTRAGAELAEWHARLAEGRTRFTHVAEGSRAVPPLFVWLVDGAGDDLAAGFEQAAGVYQERAQRRTEMLLVAALPASILLLSSMLIVQVTVLMSFAVQTMNALQVLGSF